jgi:hypothetical protein
MTTLTIQPSSKDNQIVQNYPTANFGLTNLYVANNPPFRSLVEFPIIWGTDIPAMGTLIAATLWLYDSDAYGATGRTYWAYRLLRLDWNETQSTYLIYKVDSNWTTAGAGSDGNDFTSANGASATVPVGPAWMTWDVLAQVQWAKTNNAQIAFLVKDGDESGPYQGTTLCSKEYYLDDITLRPALVIEYTGGYRSYTVRQNDERGKPIFLAECRALNMTTGALIDTKYTDNGIAVFDNLPFDAPVNIEVRWDKQFRLYENVYEASGGAIKTLVEESHVQNTDDYTKGVQVTTEPASPAVGRWYVG